MLARSLVLAATCAAFARADAGVKELRVSTLEQDAHLTLITQFNCPIRIRADAKERAADTSKKELRNQHVDCEELVQNANLFPDLEVLPGWSGNFDSLDLSWPDDVDFSDDHNHQYGAEGDDEVSDDDFENFYGEGDGEGEGEFQWADLAGEGEFETQDV
jgi:hypothetical protein